MSKTFEYDIAISFATEDKGIAWQLYKALNKNRPRLKCYFYEKEQEDQLGDHLLGIVSDVYGKKAKHAMVIISQHYADKKWTQHEWMIIDEQRSIRGYNYLIPISLDETPLPGLSDSVIFGNWHQSSLASLEKAIRRFVKDEHPKVEKFLNRSNNGDDDQTIWDKIKIEVLGGLLLAAIIAGANLAYKYYFKEDPTADLEIIWQEPHKELNIYVNDTAYRVLSGTLYRDTLTNLRANTKVEYDWEGKRYPVKTITKDELGKELISIRLTWPPADVIQYLLITKEREDGITTIEVNDTQINRLETVLLTDTLRYLRAGTILTYLDDQNREFSRSIAMPADGETFRQWVIPNGITSVDPVMTVTLLGSVDGGHPGLNVYVNNKLYRPFPYSLRLSIPGLKMGDVISFGTVERHPAILTITENIINQENYEHPLR